MSGTPQHREDRPDFGYPRDPALDAMSTEARRQLRAPAMASVAGILFAILFTGALVLLRSAPVTSMTDAQIADWFASGSDTPMVLGGLYLAPFSGVAFLWFIAVIRDQLGDREDRFFATVFFGSGLLFVALVFVASAVASSVVVGVRYLGVSPPSASTVALLRSLSYALLFAFATRAAAVFLFATATVGLHTGVFPRWFALLGFIVGAILLVAVAIYDWVILVLPAWVAFVSAFILRRERARRSAG